MELRQLRYFKVVAELQHFHKAAKILCITQPALSNQIKQLEEELATRLFERVGRGVRLSESGELVLESARRVLNEIKNMHAAIEDIESGAAGSLRVGVLQSVNALYLRKIVVDFDRHYPNISLHIDELPNHQIENQVALGEIDLGVGFILRKPYKNIKTEPLFRERWKMVVALQHEEQISDIMTGKNHGLKAVLLPEYFETRKIVNSYFEDQGIGVSQIIEVNSINYILDLVENGNSFTVLPEAFSVFKARHTLVSHYIDAIPPRQVGILTAKDRTQKKSVTKFRELVLSHLSANEN